MERSLAELAAHVGGTVEGDALALIAGASGLEEAGPRELSFYGNPRYHDSLRTTRAAAVLIAPGEPVSRTDVAWVRVPSPHLAFAQFLALFHPGPALERGVSPRAQVHPSARVDPSATVLSFVVVEAGAEVGARTVLWPGVYLGAGATVGSDCRGAPGWSSARGAWWGTGWCSSPGQWSAPTASASPSTPAARRT